MESFDQPVAIIFDLGGVLVELGPLAVLLGLESPAEADFWSKWLHSDAVRDFEGGQCSEEEFGRRAVEEFNLAGTPEEFLSRFLQWPQGLFDGAAELLVELKSAGQDLIIGVLSNSNPIHWNNQRDAAVIRSLFDAPFLSYELQLIKPDHDIFEHVQRTLGLQPAQILYFDDNQINVDAARRVGWRAEIAKGPMDCRRHLAALSLVRELATGSSAAGAPHLDH